MLWCYLFLSGYVTDSKTIVVWSDASADHKACMYYFGDSHFTSNLCCFDSTHIWMRWSIQNPFALADHTPYIFQRVGGHTSW